MVSDASGYMKAAYDVLSPTFPKMIHVTCLAHGLRHVAEEICNQYPLVNEWITCIERVFVKSPGRIRAFREFAPGVPLPPEPCITRCETWIDAASYHALHLPTLERFLGGLDHNDSENSNTILV